MAYAVYVDDEDIVWLTDFGANAIVRFDPATEAFTSFALPDADAAVRQLLGRPGEVWGAESGLDRLVVVRGPLPRSGGSRNLPSHDACCKHVSGCVRGPIPWAMLARDAGTEEEERAAIASRGMRSSR